MQSDPIEGLLVLDKPARLTSRAAVDRALGWFPRGTRIGHTGTLDPLATGVLVLCIGSATRLAEYVQAMAKTYRAKIALGGTSDTDDADGTITPTPGAQAPQRERLEHELSAFIGNIAQVPPAYSAAKIAGRRAYALARKGKTVELTARTVRIDRIDILSYAYPHLDIEVRCGKGTYIRALARDLGRSLGCGAYIDALRRSQVGWFTDADAITLDADLATAQAHLLPPWRAVQNWMPITLSPADQAKLRQGQRVSAAAYDVCGNPPADFDDLRWLAALGAGGQTFGILELKAGWLYPLKVLMTAERGGN